jgi:hypothetical protein
MSECKSFDFWALLAWLRKAGTKAADDVLAAAKLKASRRISYADGFASALALGKGGLLVTGDPELAAMADVLRVEWIGKPLPLSPEHGSPR